MNTPPRLKAKSNIDSETGFRYRYVCVTDDTPGLHCHEFYEIIITFSPGVTHKVNGATQLLPEGSLVLIRPRDVHRLTTDTAGSTEPAYITLAFSADTAEALFSYLTCPLLRESLTLCPMPPTVRLNAIEKNRLVSEISLLNTETLPHKNALKVKMRGLLAGLFAEYFSAIPKIKQKEPPLWLAELIEQMKDPQNFIPGMERMVVLSGKSREHLMRSLQSHYGLTATEFINELRLSYASNLLLTTSTPVLEICFACGFQSVSRFYKVFRGKYNQSPTDFRKQFGR